MDRLNVFALASCVGLFTAVLTPSLKADEWNKRTILTVNEAVQVPNATLQPGKYVMRLLDSPSNRHIVQVFDQDEQHLITTVLAIPNYRLQPTGKTQFGFWETPAGQPKALRSWFYPGDNFGQEFAYPKNEAMQIASAVKEPVPTTYAQSESELTSARVGTIDAEGNEREMTASTAAQTPPAPAPVAETPAEAPVQTAQAMPPPVAAPAPAPVQDQTADREATPQPTQALPHTSSPYPLIGLLGFMLIAAFGVVTVVTRRVS